MPPSAERKRAGFVISDRLWVGIYGETFRAAGAGRRDLHALVVDPRIAGAPGVASALLDLAVPALRPVYHRAIVGTVAAVRDAGDLVVITEAVPETVSLHEVLAGCRVRGVKVPPEISAAVGRAVIDAAATAHAAGVVHGAIHPRSVLIDAEGTVRLADFAVGRAVMTAVTRGASSDLIKGLAGYVAPELALGDEPSATSDVYALGALLYVMLCGELPPGTLHTSPAMERLVQRALDTELARRFTSAIELQENFSEALEDDRWGSAALPELARFVVRSRAGDALDAATEDLLASLGSIGDAPTRSIIDSGIDLPSMGGREDSVAEPPPSRDSGSLDSLISDLEEDEPLTEVDGAQHRLRGGGDRDPISEMLQIERARTGAPVVEEPVPTGKRSGERARRIGEAKRRPSKITEEQHARAASDAIAGLLDDPSEEIAIDAAPAKVPATLKVAPARFASSVPYELDPNPAPSLNAPRKLTGLIWLIVLLAAGGALVWVILDLRSKSKASDAADKRAQDEADKKTEELEGLLDDPGTIRVISEPHAGTWLRLGITPVDTFKVPTDVLLELRFQAEGYLPVDVKLPATAWEGDGANFEAKLEQTLVAGTPAAPMPPTTATTAAEATELERAMPKGGHGVVHIKSVPDNAEVWLYLGNSGDATVHDVVAGRDYELRVLKEGMRPGVVQIRAEEWRDGGDPKLNLAAAPKKAMIEKPVTLQPLPPPEPGSGSGSSKRKPK